MSNLVQSIEGMVGAGVKGLVSMAEGYLSPGSDEQQQTETAVSNGNAEEATAGDGKAEETSTIPLPSQPLTINPSNSISSTPATTSQQPITKLALPKQDQLIQTLDVPSGWIHLQSTYLDGNGESGQRKVRSFSLKNLVQKEVEVEVESDLNGQLVFWVGDDDRSARSSSSSTSSVSTTAGTATINLSLPPSSTYTIFLAFQPTPHSQPSTPANLDSPSLNDGGFTPRVKPALSRTHSSEIEPIGLPPGDGRASDTGSISGGSNQSVAGSYRSGALISTRRPETIHRAFSVHGSITIRALTAGDSAVDDVPLSPPNMSHQIIALPFFATVCRSLFTAAPIDPVSCLVMGSQQSLGEMVVDFGGESVVGGRYHRDILLVNRSEIELVWNTTVVNAPYKEAVWFELRDLDSENVFGVDHSSQPVPLPALSSRHLRLDLRVKAAVNDFEFDFIISNVNQSGNVVTCKAIGSALAETLDESLKVLSGTNIDFGQITDGVWARQMITSKNTGDKPLDVKFSASSDYDVVFRLAGVAGEDIDEDLPMEKQSRIVSSAKMESRWSADGLSRTSTRDGAGRGRGRVDSSASRPGTSHGSELSSALISATSDSGRHIDGDESIGSGFSERASSVSGPERDHSQPPSRPLSRVTSRTSSYLAHGGEGLGTESDDDEIEQPFFSGGASSSTRPNQQLLTTLTAGSPVQSLTNNPAEQVIANQIEEITMRPGTEYRVYVLYRPKLDGTNPPEIAGQLRKSNFRVYLDASPSNQRASSSTATTTSSSSSTASQSNKTRRTINCSAESCTSLIRLSSGNKIDFGETTVGASKSTILSIENLSSLSAKVEIAAISKVLSSNRNVIVIPPKEKVEEKLEFFPRRINEKYEKEIFVRNLLNRANDQVVEIRSRNVDVYNLTLHSHLYRILTPSGSNFLDFGSVVINYPSVRTVHIENLSHAPLVLDLSASQPEDIELYVKAEDEPSHSASNGHSKSSNHGGKYAEDGAPNERITSPPNGELKERFMETLQELSTKGAGTGIASTQKGRNRDKSVPGRTKKDETMKEAGPKLSVGAAVAMALKKGGRGRPVQLYGNSVVFKDRHLLEPYEYLDLSSGPPVAAHRISPRSKRGHLLDTIELEDKTKLSGQHPKVPKLDFAASAKATGLVGKTKKAKATAAVAATTTTVGTTDEAASTTSTQVHAPHHHHHHHTHHHSHLHHHAHGDPHDSNHQSHSLAEPPTSPFATATMLPPANPVGQAPAHATPTVPGPSRPRPNLGTLPSDLLKRIIPAGDGQKSPALTAKLTEPKLLPDAVDLSDLSKLSVDQLLLAITQHDAKKSSITHSSLDEEEAFVRRTIALRKELTNLVSTGKLIPARMMNVEPGKMRGLIVIMTPNGSTRPHIETRAKRADSRVFIKLVEFDRKLLNAAGRGGGAEGGSAGFAELPIRDLIIRSSCVRSVLEVQQSSINFGACDKGEVKSKVVVIHNKSDCIGLFRLRTSGSIASGDLKLGLGRYGVISAFGRKEVENFSFTPSLVGDYKETIMVENVLDSWNDQALAVKAIVRKVPAFKVEPRALDFGLVSTVTSTAWPPAQGFVVTNISKHERTFVIAVHNLSSTSFAEIDLKRDEKDAGTALSKVEEEELEALLQKLKIARRKGKKEKVEKYEKRLEELGVPRGENGDGATTPSLEGGSQFGDNMEDQQKGVSSAATSPPTAEATPLPTTTTTTVHANAVVLPPPAIPVLAPCVTTLTLTLAPNQKSKILVNLVPRSSNSVGDNSEGGGDPGDVDGVRASIMVHDRKNTDETVDVDVIATRGKVNGNTTTTTTSMASKDGSTGGEARVTGSTEDPVHLALMRHCLQLTLNCDVTPTAFCVGSTLFLPRTSKHFQPLKQHFYVFPQSSSANTGAATSSSQDQDDDTVKGLILGDGWSRQIPGNTHAEANALTNFRARYAELVKASNGTTNALPPIGEVLKDAECFATMEPCSVRTSGGPSCALELVREGVRAVYLGVEEPPDFVQCQGVTILQDGGVQVLRTIGLEEECLKAARRGRS
ncbi:hypothetical protein CI109_103344 [Kwoniella shandongensis]|uniref:Uncharacterized protein n=1 Tax=Kwoniella shandongensis TaxID=1734106 RepID=A0A5M6BWD6_9TREE|nr:uncharacterized protein CI109_004425 [Kwoniella shandongensis]KAA5527134.1 hypothetical protein CI109_004425 [Kwoniella shandongensis]